MGSDFQKGPLGGDFSIRPPKVQSAKRAADKVCICKVVVRLRASRQGKNPKSSFTEITYLTRSSLKQFFFLGGWDPQIPSKLEE